MSPDQKPTPSMPDKPAMPNENQPKQAPGGQPSGQPSPSDKPAEKKPM